MSPTLSDSDSTGPTTAAAVTVAWTISCAPHVHTVGYGDGQRQQDLQAAQKTAASVSPQHALSLDHQNTLTACALWAPASLKSCFQKEHPATWTLQSLDLGMSTADCPALPSLLHCSQLLPWFVP